MNFITTSVLATLLSMLSITAATISSTNRLLQVGDYDSDSNSLVKQSQFQLANTGNFIGQQFTLGKIGEPNFLFNSITFQIADASETVQSTKGLTLSIYDVPDINKSNSKPLLSANFTDAIFDTTTDNYVTFTLNDAERNSLGELKAGFLYTAVLSTDINVKGGPEFSIYTSGSEKSYSRGAALFRGHLPNEAQKNFDTVFQVNVTRLDDLSFLKNKAINQAEVKKTEKAVPLDIKPRSSSFYYLMGITIILLGVIGYLIFKNKREK